MTAVLMLLPVLVGAADPDVKLSIRIVPAKPVADGRTVFTVEATVTDAAGRPVPNVQVRFHAPGYAEGPDGVIVGRYSDMKRGVDYRILMPPGGYVKGLANTAGVSNTFEAKTDKNGGARALYRPPPWGEYMGRIATRVTAQYRGVASTDILFTKPKK